MKKVALELLGKQFGRLTVTSRSANLNNKSMWECRCICGIVKVFRCGDLVTGKTRSCGCLQSELVSKRMTKHGGAKVGKRISEYNIWQHMKKRCYDVDNANYYNYGARGVKICNRWLNRFDLFLKDMGYRPSKTHSLDRKNNNGNYTPSNCRWVTRDIQNKNKRNNIWITYKRRKMVIADWAKELGCAGAGNIQYFLKRGKSFGDIVKHYNKLYGKTV